jgi:hypothetical protein
MAHCAGLTRSGARSYLDRAQPHVALGTSLDMDALSRSRAGTVRQRDRYEMDAHGYEEDGVSFSLHTAILDATCPLWKS